MNSKPLILTACICSAAFFGPVFAQGGGGGGGPGGGGSSGAGSGAASAGTSAAPAGSTAATSAANASSSATSSSPTTSAATGTGITVGGDATGTSSNPAAVPGVSAAPQTSTDSTSGVPNTSPTMPSRSVLNTAQPPNTRPASAADPNALPQGLTVAPSRPGISPLSGLPVAEIPAVSRGTPPLGARINPVATGSAANDVATRARATGQPMATDPAAIAAHPQTNPLVSMGTTTVVPTPPPPVQPQPAPPASTNDVGQQWVAGHYSWVNGQWTWVDGLWQRPPQAGATWIPGSYDAQSKRWTEGHWSTTPGATRR